MTVYNLPDLPYDHNALEPHVSARVMELHHGTHHAAYVKGANETLDKLSELGADPEPATLARLERDLAFHLSGHALHSVLWQSMSPNGGGEPQGMLARQIESDFGSVDSLRKRLTGTVNSLQGSGWGALSWDPLSSRLIVQQIHDHQSTHAVGALPLLVIDGWEHAYYLDHQSKKADWVAAFWRVADWTMAETLLDSLVQSASR